MNKQNVKNDNIGGVETIEKDDIKTKTPKLYSVVLLNDDYTPMEFVVYVLQVIFRKDFEEAKQIMLHVHQKGMGVCGIYPLDVAESKTNQVLDLAKANEHPLQCKIKKV